MLRRLASWLRNSSHFHLRQERIDTLPELVGLLDRFLDDSLRYPLEWDDFISWDSRVPEIESFRQRIGTTTEPLFFSGLLSDRDKGAEIILSERNRAATLAAIPVRQSTSGSANAV